MNMLKAYTRQKVLNWGLSVFPSPKKVVRRLKFIPSALLLSSLDIDLPLHFLGLFLRAFLQRQGFILADKRTKKDVLVGSSLATWIR